MWTREEIKTKAKQILSKKYWKMLGVSILAMVLTGQAFTIIYEIGNTVNEFRGEYESKPLYSFTPYTDTEMTIFLSLIGIFLFGSLILSFIKILYSIFFGNLIFVGSAKYFLNERQGQGKINDLFYALKHNYMNAVKILFFQQLKIFLWTLLFIIPGIIKSYEYQMIPYILADNPSISNEKAFELSKQLTDGHKWNIFVLDLSFLGWLFLGMIACGVGTFFVYPYINATYAELYIKLKELKNIEIKQAIPHIPEY